MRLSPRRDYIEKDIERWIREACWTHPEWQPDSASQNLVRLLRRLPEYRNLFYQRFRKEQRPLVRALLVLAKLLYRPLESILFYTVDIGPGLFLQHGMATFIGADSIGANCWINHDVSIGFLDRSKEGPKIGNNVVIATGAKVLGGITIGDNVEIGANAVVLKDVPPNCTVVGVPGRIIQRDGKRVDERL